MFYRTTETNFNKLNFFGNWSLFIFFFSSSRVLSHLMILELLLLQDFFSFLNKYCWFFRSWSFHRAVFVPKLSLSTPGWPFWGWFAQKWLCVRSFLIIFPQGTQAELFVHSLRVPCVISRLLAIHSGQKDMERRNPRQTFFTLCQLFRT